jgi:Ulp1 family protease
MEELDNARNDRARQVVEELMDRGVNKIKNQKLKDMLNQEVLDYDTILSFYQNFLSKEKEQFEAEKN